MCYMKEDECKQEMKENHSRLVVIEKDIDRTKALLELLIKLQWWVLGILSAIFVAALIFFVNIPK